MCKVIVVTNRSLCVGDFIEQIHTLCLAGVDKIILREKDLEESEYERLACEVYSICGKFSTELILHKNVQVAKRLGICKIHLSVPMLTEYGDELSDFEKLGVSVHSLEQLRIAENFGAEYVFYGHVFETDCKKGLQPRGLRALEEICRQASVPVYAIGGISPENVGQAVAAGADGVCVMSFGMQQRETVIRSLVEKCHKL